MCCFEGGDDAGDGAGGEADEWCCEGEGRVEGGGPVALVGDGGDGVDGDCGACDAGDGAGRRGFDDRGDVWAQAPEHVVDNQRLAEQAETDAKKRKKLVKKKAPDRGYAHWDEATFDRLVSGDPEPLTYAISTIQGILGKKPIFGICLGMPAPISTTSTLASKAP